MDKNQKKGEKHRYIKEKKICLEKSYLTDNIKINKNNKTNPYNPKAFEFLDERVRKQIANKSGRRKILEIFSLLKRIIEIKEFIPNVFDSKKTKIKNEENFNIISNKRKILKKIIFKKINTSFSLLSKQKDTLNLIVNNISGFSILSGKKNVINIIGQNVLDFSIFSIKKDVINEIEKNVSDFSIISTKKDESSIVEQNISYFSIQSKKKDDKIIEVIKISDFFIPSKKRYDLMIYKSNHFIIEGQIENKDRSVSDIIKLPDIPKGLINFSLNCYMNSLLQCLYHIKGLRTSFIDPSKYSKETQKVCYSLSEVMKGLTYGNNQSFSPNNFKSTLGNINPLFKGHKGADVSDLYRTIVDSIISEIHYEYSENEDDDSGDNTNQRKYYEMAKKEVDQNNPIMKELNYFFETIYNCPEGNKCYSIQNDTSIMFELLKISKWVNNKSLDLKTCFEYNFRTVKNNEFFCSKCDGNHTNDSQDKLLTFPKNLALILNRGKGKKFTDKVDFDEIINIDKYVDDTFIENKKKKYNYKLIGVSTHLGSSSDFGHYIAYCFRENKNKYYCLNDESHRVVNFDDLKNGDPYILFYERIEANV